MTDTYTPRLRAKVLKIIEERPRTVTLKDIAEGADVPLAWLKTFAAGNIGDPSVNRVEVLYVYLTGKSLDV
ncbi:hypothetical protein [Citromicrobium sp. JLT1363]|uniref:hypothetical protein n=1 Tax=Citromicrobium sp. JLT1363 TaxID=517722 RepID=UPI001111EBCC|nr:hypothetical protein [Citromicrobium sp. JLT1363]